MVLGATAQTHQQRALSQMKVLGGAPMGERKFGGHNNCPGFSTGKEDPYLDSGRFSPLRTGVSFPIQQLAPLG